MVYLGGIGSLAGSILGAVIFTFLAQALQPLGTWRMVIMPLRSWFSDALSASRHPGFARADLVSSSWAGAFQAATEL